MSLNNILRSTANNKLQYVPKQRSTAEKIGGFFRMLAYYISWRKEQYHEREPNRQKEIAIVAINILANLPSYQESLLCQEQILYTNEKEGYQVRLMEGKVIACKYKVSRSYFSQSEPVITRCHERELINLCELNDYDGFISHLNLTYQNSYVWKDLILSWAVEAATLAIPQYGNVAANLLYIVYADAEARINEDFKLNDLLAQATRRRFDEFDASSANSSESILLTGFFLKNNPQLREKLVKMGISNPSLRRKVKEQLFQFVVQGKLDVNCHMNLIQLFNATDMLACFDQAQLQLNQNT